MSDFDWTGATSSAWTTGSNWSVAGTPQASPPTAADNAVFSVADASDCAIGGAATCLNLVATGYIGTISGSSALAISGGFTSGSATTWSYSGTITFNATSGTHSINTNGASINSALVFDGVGGSWQLASNVVNAATRDITLTNGTFDFNDFNYEGRNFVFTGTNTRVLRLGNGTLTAKNVTGTSWSLADPTNLTFDAEGSTIVIAGSSTGTARTFAGGGLTYNNFTFSGSGTGDLIITGTNTFNTFRISVVPLEIQVTAGTTQSAAQWNISGTSGNVNAFTSVTPGSTYTLHKVGGGIVEVDFVSLTDAICTPENNWYIGAGGTVGSGTTGAIATAEPDTPLRIGRRRHMVRSV